MGNGNFNCNKISPVSGCFISIAACSHIWLQNLLNFNIIFKCNFFLKNYWNIVDLQCNVSFRYTAKWFSYTHTHTGVYVHIFFFRFFPIIYYYQGIRSNRQSVWRTMDRGLWPCTGSRDQDHPQQKEMLKGKMVVWGGLTHSYEKKRSERQRKKGKIYPFECRVPKNTRRDKKAFLSHQCKEIEKNNRMGKTWDLFEKIRDTKGTNILCKDLHNKGHKWYRPNRSRRY